ncbi:MAG TPA: hypothetical protein VFS67_11215 [Polyangiaceae bacterium]|nr:hypothetical protein [Polyangiaceae bacterium]
MKPIRSPLPFSWFGIGLSFLGLSLGLGCGQQNETAALRALRVSGDVSLLCLGRDADGNLTQGLERNQCPDFEHAPNSAEQRHLMALVTQPSTGEVAAIDVTASPPRVIDNEPTQPGYSFLPVGAEPTALVTTPGGIASFVGVAETGREGIFGLPTSCISTRPDAAPLRDVRAWPACRLPSAPGPMILLTDPAVDDDLDPATPPRVRERCSASYVDAEELIGAAPAAAREECPADLAREGGPPGRRKLAVTLPALSEIWVLDAQELLDRAPGSFDACVPEKTVVLRAEAPDQAERLPGDLQPSSPSCTPLGYDQGPAPVDARPWPSDLALDDASRLFVADSQAPVIHVLDAGDPCTLQSLPGLFPLSYTDPGAVITTRKVAVSPLTTKGQRFVYAVDDSSTITAGTLIPFDVSPGSTQRTPMVRERAPFTPGEPPDRIALTRDVADVEFAYVDYFPIADPATGVAIEGVACDPDPLIPQDSPAALYRTSADRGRGARPSNLRGTFAYAALHSGQVAVVDVEDLDAACRRPQAVNHDSVEDATGCKNDDPNVSTQFGYSLGGAVPTVSDELSCNVVVPHRARGRNFFSNPPSGSTVSAGLVSFPSLTLSDGRSVLTDQSDEGRNQPKMLGVPYVQGQAQRVFIGPVQYGTEPPDPPLELDPTETEHSSVLLSYEEPRAFIPNEDFTATYEGVVRTAREALFRAPADGSSVGTVEEGVNASFCSSGVQDLDLITEVGQSLKVSDPNSLAKFALDHSDFVQITGPLLDEDDDYWRTGGAQCGAELLAGVDQGNEQRGRPACQELFGTPQVPTTLRDLRIVAASEDSLSVEPREAPEARRNSPTRRRQLMQLVSCCFPEPTTYVVRAGKQWVIRGGATGVGHHVRTDPDTHRCVNDCSPLTQRLVGRAFEISCSANCPPNADGRLSVGRANANDFVCVADDTRGGVQPGQPGSECVFQSITTRMAFYRGLNETRRDTRFRWQLTDGFGPLSVPLTSSNTLVSTPRSLLALPELGQLLITDGTAAGLTFLSIASSNLTTTSIY